MLACCLRKISLSISECALCILFFSRSRPGIDLDLRKHFTADLSVQPGPVPRRVLIPLLQQRGQAAQGCVSVGDTVHAGQKIGLAQGRISAHVHASVSGKVHALSSLAGFDNRVTPVVEITTQEDIPALTTLPRTWDQVWQLSPDQIRALIAEAGIVGMGGAAFPTQLKLEIPSGKQVDALIINGAECEAYVNCDFRLMVEQPAELVEGIRLLQKTLGQVPAYLGIEADKLPRLASLIRLCTSENKITLTPLPTLYPQGDETLLVQCSSLYLRYSKMRYIQFYRSFKRWRGQSFLPKDRKPKPGSFFNLQNGVASRILKIMIRGFADVKLMNRIGRAAGALATAPGKPTVISLLGSLTTPISPGERRFFGLLFYIRLRRLKCFAKTLWRSSKCPHFCSDKCPP